MAIWRKDPVVRLLTREPYTTDPAPHWLFLPNKPTETKSVYVGVAGPPRGMIQLTKLERLTGALRGLSPLFVESKHAGLEFRGTGGHASAIEVESCADAKNERQAQRILNRPVFQCRGSNLRILNRSNARHCLRTLRVTCPKSRAIAVRGIYSAVRMSDLTGPVDIQTTHARIVLLDNEGDVNARVSEGIVDYSGHHGSVTLFATWEINLNLTEPQFDGTLAATADGPIRVLLPPDFTTPFEANVAKDSPFVCRADVRPSVVCREQNGRAIYTFGEDSPAVRLMSIKGPIVIDNAQGPWEEAAARALASHHFAS